MKDAKAISQNINSTRNMLKSLEFERNKFIEIFLSSLEDRRIRCQFQKGIFEKYEIKLSKCLIQIKNTNCDHYRVRMFYDGQRVLEFYFSSWSDTRFYRIECSDSFYEELDSFTDVLSVIRMKYEDYESNLRERTDRVFEKQSIRKQLERDLRSRF